MEIGKPLRVIEAIPVPESEPVKVPEKKRRMRKYGLCESIRR
jgi:hypothetical protein